MTTLLTLRGVSVELTSDEGRRFVSDCVRAGENLISDAELAEIWEVSHEQLRTLATNKFFARAVRAESERRIRSGLAAKEAASKYFIKSPKILDDIQSDETSHHRSKVEAIRELRQIAAPENAGGPTQSDRFIITINIGDESLHFNKSRAIDAGIPEEPKLVDKRPKTPKLIVDNRSKE